MRYVIMVQNGRFIIESGFIGYSTGTVMEATKFNTKKEAQVFFKRNNVSSTFIGAKIVEIDF